MERVHNIGQGCPRTIRGRGVNTPGKGEAMAKILDEVPEGKKRGPKGKYPWDDWFDGRIWELEAGKDFDCTLPTMEDNVRKAAKRLDVCVVVHRTDAAIIIEPAEWD